jgi:hypothetical protein
LVMNIREFRYFCYICLFCIGNLLHCQRRIHWKLVEIIHILLNVDSLLRWFATNHTDRGFQYWQGFIFATASTFTLRYRGGGGERLFALV